ncbi:PAS domain-containing sensor histidine kinase [Oceaniglobus ichthyenteri]|uniref:sensor histidine kinase n=1 Tax=Oceaniglobus ichthyenteri TaxID=2136177 RepID=UPI000D356CA6|nr:PAS domain-containing sensor histidine kinase [Oceaniglobus ichthyenteri]
MSSTRTHPPLRGTARAGQTDASVNRAETGRAMEKSPIIDAFKRMQVPLMIVGADGRILECNQATEHLFAYPHGQLVGRATREILPDASLEWLQAQIVPPAIDTVIKGMTGRTRDGDTMLLAANVTAWTDSERGLQHALVLRDITLDASAEKLARNQMKRTNDAIIGAGIAVFEYNRVTDTIIVCDQWRAILELEQSEPVDMRNEWRGRVHPDDLETALAPMYRCLAGEAGRVSCDYRLLSRDGLRWRWIRSDISIAERDASGTVIRINGAMSDITDRKSVETALRRSVERFRSTFEGAAIGMAIVTPDGRFLEVNPAICAAFGYSEEDLLKTDFQTLTHPEDLASDLAQFERLKAGEISCYQLEKRYFRSNGAIMWGLLAVTMIRDDENRPDQVIKQIIDVTERRRLSELKSEFVSTVSHELRTPLTSILGSLTLLSSMDAEPFSDEAQRLLYIAEQNGERLHALINDVLDFEKFSAQQMRVHLFSQPIVPLIDEAVMASLSYADKFGVRFVVHTPDRALRAYADPKRFQQVMANLLSNAAKFATEGSVIEIVTEDIGSAIRVSVTNDGQTIPKAFHDDLFKPFAQAAPSSTRRRSGTGLGLSITKQIVEQTGGEIGFDSPEGGQTTFWFTAPKNNPH